MLFRFFHLVLFGVLPVCVAAQWNNDPTVGNPLVVFQGRQESSVACSDGAGGAFVAWWDNRGAENNVFRDIHVQRMTANGQPAWVNSTSIGISSLGYGDMDMIPDGNGGAVLCFINGSGSSLNIQAQRISSIGEKLWNNGLPLPVCAALNAQYNCRIADAGNGSFVIVWQDERAGNSLDDIYAQKILADGTVSWSINGVVVNAAAQYQENPGVTGIGNGEVLVTWDDYRNGTNYDVYAQKLNSEGIRQWRGTDNLLSGRIISGATANQRFPKICGDGSTGALIAWQDFRNGAQNSTDIYAQRIDSSGTVRWTANGVLMAGTETVQTIDGIFSSGNGAVIHWLQYPAGGSAESYDVWAQKVDTAGTVLWGTNGLAVCNAPFLQNFMRGAPDGSGGAFFSWIDERSGNVLTNELYAQRISHSGQPQWGNNGRVVSNAPAGSRSNPQMVAEGCGTLLIWEDSRNTAGSLVDLDIYATSLDCNGNTAGNAAVLTWAGTLSSDWLQPGNWSAGRIPTLSDPVIIPAGTPFQPQVNNGVLAVCKSIQVSPGAGITIVAGGDLRVAQ